MTEGPTRTRRRSVPSPCGTGTAVPVISGHGKAVWERRSTAQETGGPRTEMTRGRRKRCQEDRSTTTTTTTTVNPSRGPGERMPTTAAVRRCANTCAWAGMARGAFGANTIDTTRRPRQTSNSAFSSRSGRQSSAVRWRSCGPRSDGTTSSCSASAPSPRHRPPHTPWT